MALRRDRDLLLTAVVSLRKRERDRADGQEHKEVKRTSNQVRFDGGINLFFHGCCPS
jgi:hypothetical protein